MLPILTVLHGSQHQMGDANNFSISIQLGFTAEEHVALTDIPSNRKSAKDLITKFNEKILTAERTINEEKKLNETFQVKDDQISNSMTENLDEISMKDMDDSESTGQMKLF